MFRRSLARHLVLLAAGFSAALASADVLDTGDGGFTVKNTVTVPVDGLKAYTTVVDQVGKWWDPAHTYSGDAANLWIEAKPQGCFCERLPDQGFVRHMAVIFAAPGKILRLSGGLGPLQSIAASGVMTWSFKPAEKGTTVEVRYTVGGYNPAGFKDLAPSVDSVLRAQLERYQRLLATGKP
ncbi:MAG TPA: ATPase [Thermoanaerobaculia bacterium]|nr:ATPase [Thermoanaerobaculia bacterium]